MDLIDQDMPDEETTDLAVPAGPAGGALMRPDNAEMVIREASYRFNLAHGEAAVFLAHAMRLDLDPFIGQSLKILKHQRVRNG